MIKDNVFWQKRFFFFRWNNFPKLMVSGWGPIVLKHSGSEIGLNDTGLSYFFSLILETTSTIRNILLPLSKVCCIST